MDKPIFQGCHFASTYKQDNQTYFVYNANAIYKNEHYYGTGVGPSADEGYKNAKKNVLDTINAQFQPQASQVDATPVDKSTWNGGSDRPISEKQIELIKNLAEQHNLDAERIAQNSYGKSIGKLMGKDAHDIIQILMGRTK